MEILIAIFILGIVMATVLGTFTGIISSSRQAEKKAELYQTGRAVIDLIAMDIRGIFKQPLKEGGSFFNGNSEMVEEKSMSRVEFITTHALPMGIKRNPFLSEVGYHVKKNMKKDTYSLWRRSQFPPEYPYGEGGREVPVCRIIDKFRLEFVYNNDIKTSAISFNKK